VDYQLAPQRIGSRRPPRRSLVAVAIVALAVAAVARLGAEPPAPPVEPSVPPAAIAGPSAAPMATPGVPWQLAGPDPTLSPPATVDCTTVPASECRAALLAAQGVVVSLGARPLRAIVHASLVCGSYRDCPPSLIAGKQRLGSVVIRFDDGRETWVNVVRPDPNRHAADAPPEARVVHWTTWSG
jgi:hypothetical protein